MSKKKTSPKHPQASADIQRHPAPTAPLTPPTPFIVAFAGQKGGVGKSTAAVSCAVEWHAKGRAVLVVDTDPQGTLRTWSAVAAETGADAPTVVAMGPGLSQPGQLPRLAASYDLVVIDCPPRLDMVQREVLMLADVVVLPCGPSAFDAWALAETLQLVQQARVLRPALDARILISRKQPQTSVGRQARDVLAPSGLPVLASELALRVTYQEAPAAGLGPTTYDPGSAAADEVRALVKELSEGRA